MAPSSAARWTSRSRSASLTVSRAISVNSGSRSASATASLMLALRACFTFSSVMASPMPPRIMSRNAMCTRRRSSVAPMKFAWTSTIEATPGGESNAAINKRQIGRRRSGRAASVRPARATRREAAQGSLLAMAAGRSRRRRLRFDGWGWLGCAWLQPLAGSRASPAVENRVQVEES
ncbi:unnamed protein product [Pelagomonas calceolata]|uniref:Uncharacterized protein n=1 Tax=Pelagomonas calceolata TaxID=35677 RepID=A0A8J2SLN7_9STRA|nr:unnamed protein product [Pelagomonas calceolata]